MPAASPPRTISAPGSSKPGANSSPFSSRLVRNESGRLAPSASWPPNLPEPLEVPIARCEVCGRRVQQPSRAIINGRIVCAIHNPKPDQRAHRRDERPRREFERPEPAMAGAGAPSPGIVTAPPVAAPPESRPPEAPAEQPAAAPVAETPAVTPEEVPAPGQQDTVPPVAADPALAEDAGTEPARTEATT